LNWVDLIMGIVLIGFAVRGLVKGFFRELCALVGIFLGLWVALLQFVPVGEWIQVRVPLADPLPFHIAFLAIFFGLSTAVSIGGFLLQKIAKVLLMGWLDAVMGLGFGLVKGVMILTVLLFLLAHLPLSDSIDAQLRSSTVVDHLELLNPFLEESVQAYNRFGGEHLWDQLRVPKSPRPPGMGHGRAAEDAFTR
jgi:membrane protein required for colicin V production